MRTFILALLVASATAAGCATNSPDADDPSGGETRRRPTILELAPAPIGF